MDGAKGNVGEGRAAYGLTMRSHADVTRFFAGLDLLEPGVVSVDEWRRDAAAPHSARRPGHAHPRRGRPQALSRRTPGRTPARGARSNRLRAPPGTAVA